MLRPSLLAASALLALACSKPEPPTITPKQATVTGLTPAGVDMKVAIEAANPNGFELSAKSMTAHLQLDKYDLGTMTAPSGVSIPAHGKTTLEAPITLKWTDLSALGGLAMSNGPVPYKVDGTLTIGTDSVHFDLPFHLEGTIPHDQIVKATVNSLPKLPGFPMLQNAPR